jgi:regulator of sirC expression with transglutaminase-like and TPR domain
MRDKPSVRERFEAIASSPDTQIDLAEAALLMAAQQYPELDVRAWMGRLDELALPLLPRVIRVDDVTQRLGILRHYLHDELGFRGNEDEYYDPRNSLLNDVIERRVGIPITLSVLYLEVGKRVGLTLDGVGFPAHFLVAHDAPRGPFMDPFHGGRILSAHECEGLLAQLSKGKVRFEDRYLRPVGARQILVRMLTNLKGAYFRVKEYERAIGAINLLLLLAPDSAREYRDRGALYLELEAFRMALGDFERYLAAGPPAEERTAISQAVQDLRKRVRSLH